MTDDELIGKTFGGCQILDLIGMGGMATVYRAHQVSMNRTVAVKILPRHFLNDDTYMMRFEREVRIAAQLEHRGIVPVHDFGLFEGQPYIVMRYMAGGSVDDLLNNGALPLDHALRIVEQIAPALDFAHTKGVLHRDMKPSNVLLDDIGDAFLTDFGIARLMSDVNLGVTTQGVVGTPSYMSPEQAQGGTLDGRSDLYSLGVMVFEMVTGRRPFESDTPYGVAIKHVNDAPPMPRAFNPDLPAGVEQAILIALNKHPDGRYPDAISFAEALKRALRPSISDTEPNLKRPEVPAYARPTPQTGTPYPAPPVGGTIMPTPTPPPLSQSISTPSVPLYPLRPPSKPKRGGITGMVLSAGVGVLIGCALLTGLVVIALLIIANADRIERAASGTPNGRGDDTVEASGIPIGGNALTTPLNTLPSRRTTTTAPTEMPTELPTDPIPNSGRLIYAAENDNNFDIYALDMATGEIFRLTDHFADDIAPVVSPDGSQIAFLSDRDGDFDIYVMSSDGGAARRLTVNQVTDRAPAWTPDGTALYFASDVRNDGTSDILRIGADGSDLRLIHSESIATRARLSDPHPSEDGRWLLFTGGAADDATTWEIGRLDLESGEAEWLTQNRIKDWMPIFLPNGDILYATEGNGYSALAAMDDDGGDRRMIFDSSGYDWGARIMPDGTLLFTSDMDGFDQVYALNIMAGSVLRAANPDDAVLLTDGAWGGFIPAETREN